jgi:hypothetical protein
MTIAMNLNNDFQPPAIEFRNVSVSFDEHQVLNDAFPASFY